jgi:Protein of unknown function (DUF1553)/Protein of unknown function (DUF1549)/Planctomycete cytochrome C
VSEIAARTRYYPLFLLLLALLSLFKLTLRLQSPPATQSRPAAPSPAVARVDYAQDIKPILSEHCYPCHGPTRHRAGLRLDTLASIHKGADGTPVVVPHHAGKSLLIAAVTGADGAPQMPPSGQPLAAAQIDRLRRWIDEGAPGPKAEETAATPRTHWAFQIPVRPKLPPAPKPEWVRNPIDAFIAAAHAKHRLAPSPPANKGLLLRRVYLDLIGLPPTRIELDAFLADQSQDAYEKVVDHLLASPRYGERWARHWMDVWRYSDADGRKSMKQVWWSHNDIWHWRDWIIQSLNHDKGYDRMVVEMLAGDELAPNDPDAVAGTGFLARSRVTVNRNLWLSNTVEHTAKAFLGVTMNCARCHDHKFDPISQREYYSFRALFEPHDIRGEGSPNPAQSVATNFACVYDAHPDQPTYLFIRGDENRPDTQTRIAPGIPVSLASKDFAIQPVRLPDGKCSTGRRLALARWLVSSSNPLTARVAVNHVWLRHFGRGLVDNPYDFGLRARPPWNPELLDWLAVEFQARGWSLKWLHRLIVTSNTYRMSSAVQAAPSQNLAADPENRYLWRMNPRRMEAEVVRDSLLQLAGELDTSTGGPALPLEADEKSRRRSLYYRYSREDKLPFLIIFDGASVEECYQRPESVVPQQALALLNSEFVHRRARAISDRLTTERVNDQGFIRAAFEHLLSRPPTEHEYAECRQFLRESGGDHLIQVLVNHNDFVTIR